MLDLVVRLLWKLRPGLEAEWGIIGRTAGYSWGAHSRTAGPGGDSASGSGPSCTARTLPSRAALLNASNASGYVLYFLNIAPEISLTLRAA